MTDRRRIILFAILVMAAVSLAAAGTTIYILYRAAFAEEKARLVETVKSQARLIEAIARFNAVGSDEDPKCVGDTTLRQMIDAHGHYEGFGKTGEFALARREGEMIVFLLSHRHYDLDDLQPVPFDSELAEPMRLALLGRSGTVVGPDYRGATVLAAYEPVADLDWGIVAKIDLAEIRAPFIKAGLTAAFSALLVILLGAAFSVRVSNPLLTRLEESEARNRAVLSSTYDPVVTIDSRGIIHSVSDSVERVFGWKPDKLLGQNVKVLMPEPHRSQHDDYLARYRRTGTTDILGRTREFEALHKEGNKVPIELSVSRAEIPGQQETLLTGIVHDITERKRTDEILRQSEERFRKIFDHSNDAVFVLAVEQDEILDANATACKMLEYSREQLLSTPISVIHPNEMPQLRAFADSVVQRGSGWTDELTCLTKSGARLPAEISASQFELHGRKCVLATVRDISERKRAEKALRESEERFSSILESAIDAIITIDVRGVVRLFNEAAETVFRCRSGEAIGQPFDRFASEAFRKLLERFIRDSQPRKARKRFVGAADGLTARRADGEEFPVEATISQTEAAGERLYTIILRDVDELMRAEEELRRLEIENIYLREQSDTGFGEVVGDSTAIRKTLDSVKQVAQSDSAVLVTGETGTGKELIATAIHDLSPRKNHMFVKVNCAALPGGLIESELFGHEQGAFTGALARKIGRFEMAHEGTILLDEIGDLPLDLQGKLLRVLQEGEFERVGGAATLKVDARLIAATNRDLKREVDRQRFRPDLYYRLNVFPIHIPPLRERREDIPLLVRHFVMKYAAKMGKRIDSIPQTALDALAAYDWPGNVRELQNVVERAVIISRGPQFELTEWPPSRRKGPGEASMVTLDELQRQHILAVLQSTDWRVRGRGGAAEVLGLKATTLEARMKKLGIIRRQ